MSSQAILSSRPLALQVTHEILTERRLDLDYYLPERVAAEAKINDGRFSISTLNSLRHVERPITDGIRRHDKSKSGVHLIRTQNLAGPFVDYGGTAFISEEWHRTSLKSEVAPGDLLVAIRGYLGAAAIVGNGAPRANINQHVARIAVDESNCSTRYLWAFMSCRFGRTALERYVTGTVQRGVTLPDLRRLRVPLPDRRVQNHIGAKVALAECCRRRALKDRQKIDLIFENLLRESRFEPPQTLSRWVPGYELAARWLNAGFYRQVFVELHAHLRSASVQTIPLGRVARCNRTKVRPQGIVRYIEISDIDSDNGVISGGRECTPEDTPKNAQRIIATDDILMSTRRPDRGAVACVRKEYSGSFCSVFLARIQCTASEMLPQFLHEYLRRPVARAFIAQRCTETTYPVISEDDIETIPVPLVPTDAQQRISSASLRAEELRRKGGALVNEATADVEALIEGTLDVDAILSGKLSAPSTEDIPDLAEKEA